MCITESLCYTIEINTTLLSNYTSIKKKLQWLSTVADIIANDDDEDQWSVMIMKTGRGRRNIQGLQRYKNHSLYWKVYTRVLEKVLL